VISWKRNFYTLWIAETIAIIGFQFIQPFLPLYIRQFLADDLGEVAVWAGLISTAGGFAMAISAPIWGIVADRVGRKPMVVRAMLGGGITVLLMALTRSVEQVLIVRFIQGLLAGTVTACIAMVSTTTPKEQVGFALGMMQMALLLGASVGPLLGGLMIDRVGYRPSFTLAGACVLTACIFVQMWVREEFQRPSRPEPGQIRQRSVQTAKAFLSNQPYIAMLISLMLIRFAFSVAMPIFPLFIQQLADTDKIASVAGLVFSLAGLAGALSSAVFGRLSDRTGYHRTLVWALLASGVLYMTQSFVRSVFELGIIRVALGLGYGAITPAANAMISRVVPQEHRGKAFGLTTSAAAAGWAIGPIFGGKIGATWGFRSVFAVTGVLFLIVGLWVLKAVREPGGKL